MPRPIGTAPHFEIPDDEAVGADHYPVGAKRSQAQIQKLSRILQWDASPDRGA
ncbi:hypothetical protein JW998_06140 [candidate division KSB1 bacterium]|nr:hypothetical protein [candidate division KSB1 bacterium]